MDQKTKDTVIKAPAAMKRPERQVTHGIERTDNYAWLRAGNWQEVMRDPSTLSPEIRSYLEAENAYTAQMMADTEGLQDKLFQEMKARIKEDDSTVPAPDGPYAYSVSYVTGGQHPRLCREPREGGVSQILLDGDALAAG
jgi:oligopeptidase B